MSAKVTKNSLFIKLNGKNRRVSLKPKTKAPDYFKELNFAVPDYLQKIMEKYGNVMPDFGNF